MGNHVVLLALLPDEQALAMKGPLCHNQRHVIEGLAFPIIYLPWTLGIFWNWICFSWNREGVCVNPPLFLPSVKEVNTLGNQVVLLALLPDERALAVKGPLCHNKTYLSSANTDNRGSCGNFHNFSNKLFIGVFSGSSITIITYLGQAPWLCFPIIYLP